MMPLPPRQPMMMPPPPRQPSCSPSLARKRDAVTEDLLPLPARRARVGGPAGAAAAFPTPARLAVVRSTVEALAQDMARVKSLGQTACESSDALVSEEQRERFERKVKELMERVGALERRVDRLANGVCVTQ